MPINMPKGDIPQRSLDIEHKICEDCGEPFSTSCGALICDDCGINEDSNLEEELADRRERGR
jgi:predicted amidophosphoribosyltransferase